MSDQPKLQKLLELIMLLSNGRKYTIGRICDLLSISERTAKRYIRTIRDAGFIIPRPLYGAYYIDKQSPYFKEINKLVYFSQEEAQIVYNAIHAITGDNIYKQSLIRKLCALYNTPEIAQTILNMQQSDNVRQLITAIEKKRTVELKNYRSAHSDKTSNRTVEPFKFTTNFISIWAFDLKSKKNKMFKVSRIGSVEILPTYWENEGKHKDAQSDHFRISTNDTIPVRLILSLRASELLKEEYPLAENSIKQISDNRFEYSATVQSLEGVGRFVLGLCNEIEIIEPEELKKTLKKKMEIFKKANS